MLPSQTRASALPDRPDAQIGSTRSYDGLNAEATAVVSPLEGTKTRSIPQQIARFQILRLLGDGGFGSVYLAYDPTLGREIALKIPRAPDSLAGREKQKFLDEARNAARLKHPHVITIYDAGDSAESEVFIAMEYVEGESLAQRLRRGKLSVSETVRLCSQVADAVHHGHKLGLVHRDLKPSNILIDLAGNARVCDFGLALHEDEQHEHRGEVSGTRAYMSPEQIQGNAHLLDGRTDVWSLGVVLYECLAGRRPFRGDDWPEIREEILTRDPKPLRQIDDSIPAAMDALCRQALQRNIGERLSTAHDFRQALLRIERKPQRRPLLAIGGTFALVAAVAFSAFALSRRSADDASEKTRGQSTPQPSPQASLERDAPTAPAHVELAPEPLEIRPGRRNLLSRAPQAVFFVDGKDSHYLFSEELQRLIVASRTWSVFAGGPHPQEMWLDVAMSHSNPPGIAGVFWGLHLEPLPDGTTQNSFLALCIKPDSADVANARVCLYCTTIAKNKFGQSEIGFPQGTTIAVVRLDWAAPVALKLHIRQGRLLELSVQGVIVDLPERAAQIDWQAYATGQCGFVAANRQVVFTWALLDTHQKEQ